MDEQQPPDWWPFRGPPGQAPDVEPPSQELPPVSPWARPREFPQQGPYPSHPYQQVPYRQVPYQPPQYQHAQYQQSWSPPPGAGWPQQPRPVERSPLQPGTHGWPNPHAWAAPPAARPPRGTRRAVGILAVFLVVGIVIGFVLNDLFDRGTGAAILPVGSTATATPSPTPSASPTPAPTATPSQEESSRSTYTPYQVPTTTWGALPEPTPTTSAERTVMTNAIYALDVPGATTCPIVPDDVGTNAAFRKLSQQLVDCHFQSWVPVFEKMDLSLSKPKLVTFRDKVTTRCGTVSDEQSFYCPASSSIYLSEQRFESSQDWWRLHFANTITHEFMHHVQSEANILEAAYDLDMASDERTRRVELQAYCWTSRAMLITPAYAFGAEDYRILKEWTTEGGSDTHGSTKSRRYWWVRGFEQPTMSGCNTWVVDADQVT